MPDEYEPRLDVFHPADDTESIAKTMKKRRRRGRPRGNIVGESLVSVRVQKRLRRELNFVCALEGRTLANLVRFILEQEMKRRMEAYEQNHGGPG